MHDVIKYGLWISAPLLLLVIAAKMTVARLYRTYPAFFTYVVFHVLRFLALFYLNHRGTVKAYFVSYWVAEAIDIVLELAIIYELYADVLQPYEGIRAVGSLLFRWAFVILVMVAVISAAAAPGADASRTMAGILVLDRSAAVVKGGLLFLLFLFSSYFHLRWRPSAFGIGVGLALYISVALAAVAMRSQFPSFAGGTYSLLKAAAYDCGLLIWVGYFLAKEPAHEPVVSYVPNNDLTHWNEALLGLLRQ